LQSAKLKASPQKAKKATTARKPPSRPVSSASTSDEEEQDCLNRLTQPMPHVDEVGVIPKQRKRRSNPMRMPLALLTTSGVAKTVWETTVSIVKNQEMVGLFIADYCGNACGFSSW
tara:strand:+ start:18 stop:365 length:348 start_codon:yes stop_codon:yes gene_type:complete